MLVFKIKNAYTNIKKAWVVIMFINLIKLSPLFNSILVTALFLILGEIVSFFNLPTPIYEFILLVVYLSFAYFFTKKIDRQSLKGWELKISKQSFKGVSISLVATSFIIIFATILSQSLFHDEIIKLRGTVNFITITVTLLLFFIESFIKQGFPEELIFRGYMVQSLRKKYNIFQTMLLSVGLFTLMHAIHIFMDGLFYGILTMFYAFSFACLAYLLKSVFNTTWAAVAVHGGVHMTRMILMLFGFSENNHAIFFQSLLLFVVSLLVFFKVRNKVFMC